MSEDEKDIQLAISSVIKTAMSFIDIDEKELAKRCGITAYGLQNIFDCKRLLTFRMLAKMQKALNIKIEVRAI